MSSDQTQSGSEYLAKSILANVLCNFFLFWEDERKRESTNLHWSASRFSGASQLSNFTDLDFEVIFRGLKLRVHTSPLASCYTYRTTPIIRWISGDRMIRSTIMWRRATSQLVATWSFETPRDVTARGHLIFWGCASKTFRDHDKSREQAGPFISACPCKVALAKVKLLSFLLWSRTASRSTVVRVLRWNNHAHGDDVEHATTRLELWSGDASGNHDIRKLDGGRGTQERPGPP